LGEGELVYSDGLVRKLCADILKEKEPEKMEGLISLLQAVIKEDQEEIRIRMAFLTKKYANVISDTKAAD
jgi:hypothetical protein